jgi:hypothetical protein
MPNPVHLILTGRPLGNADFIGGLERWAAGREADAGKEAERGRCRAVGVVEVGRMGIGILSPYYVLDPRNLYTC